MLMPKSTAGMLCPYIRLGREPTRYIRSPLKAEIYCRNALPLQW